MSRKKQERGIRYRLRLLMRNYLVSQGVDPTGKGRGEIRALVAAKLGLSAKEAQNNAKMRAALGDSPVKRAVSGKRIPARHFAGKSFYESDEWRILRYKALKLHGGCCQCCGERAALGKPLHVDHIKPRSKFPELELSLDNLQVLCKDCNLGKLAWDQTDWRPTAGVVQ